MEVSPQRDLHLSVSVVVHNSPLTVLEGTIRSLLQAARVASKSSRLMHVALYIVDNCSAPEYRSRLQQVMGNWPQDELFSVSFLPQPDNRGFGYGHNRVLASLLSDFHLVLNPDTELQEDALTAGIQAMISEEDVVLVSPKVAGGNGEQEFLCKRYPSVLVLLLRGFTPGFICRLFRSKLADYEMRDICSTDCQVDVDIASGCCMLVRTAALQTLGGFDEDFFLYFEDFDLSLRLKSQGRLVFNPAMKILHHGGYAASKGILHVRYFVSSGVRFFRRHGWRWI